MAKLNKKFPPIHGTLTIEQFEKCVDVKSFDKCGSCGQPVYNPNFYDEEMCGPCMTGEAETIMWSEADADYDGRYESEEFIKNYK